MALTTISPHDAQELIARGAKLIDIRDADEYLREHIPEADLAPLSVLEQSGLPPKLRREQIIFHCQAGKRTILSFVSRRLIDDWLFRCQIALFMLTVALGAVTARL